MLSRFKSLISAVSAVAVAAVVAFAANGAAAQSGEPIKIGFSMAMTGGLAANGKSALLAQKIWEEDINAKGGLLGRPVKLIYYDDQSNPATVPGIYTKLLDVDKVDLVIGPYATAQIAPAMPIVIQRNKLFIGLLGLAVNSEFNYPNYFAMIPSGPDPKPSFTKGFFDTAMAQTPKPADASRSSPPTRSSRATPRTAPARTPRRRGSRSSTTRPIRPRPPTSRRSCARSRRPIPTSWCCAPIRRIRSGWCARSTRSASSRR